MHIRQAILTKYVGPTNTRGSRVAASCMAKRIIVSWDDALNADDNHQAAALALRDAMGWAGDMIGGGLPDGRCIAWVFAS